MAQEIYHRSNWGIASNEWGSTYLNADLTNELYKRAGYYENSWATDKILNKIGTKPSIILTPTAYEDGKLNSVKPAKTLGIELVTNGNFDTDSDWSKTNATISGGKATITVVSGAYSLISQSTIYQNGRIYKLTAQVQGTSGKACTFFDNGSNTGGLNLSNGIVNFDGSLQNVNITFTANSNSNQLLIVRNGGGDYSFTIDNVSIKEVIDADFDFTRGSSATRVNEKGLIQTDDTDLPRIDYTDGEGSLLLEPQSTNYLKYSEHFSQSYWKKEGGNQVINPNVEISPSGTLTADKLTVSSGTITTRKLWYPRSTTVGLQYTFSVYIKAVSNQVNTGFISIANLDTHINQTFFTATDVWQRVVVTATSNSAANIRFLITGDPNCQIYIWGAQAEQGSYPTSYIPTNGTTVTRLADEANNAGNSDLINSTEGVLYAEIAALADDGTFRVISLDSGDNTNVVKLGYRNTSNAIYYEVRSGDVSQAFQIYTTTDVKQFHKVAVLYQQSNFKLFVNGVNVLYDTSGITPVGLNNISFDVNNYADFYGKVKCVAVFKEALSDEELHKLTNPYESFEQRVKADGGDIESLNCIPRIYR